MASKPTSTRSKICLPGFGLPLGVLPDSPSAMFPNALSSRFEAFVTTQREFIMMMIMDRITDKAGWEEKVWNEEITNHWRAELLKDGEDSDDDEIENAENEGVDEETQEKDKADKRGIMRVTNEMLDWCFAELEYKAELLKTTDCVESLDGIFKSDKIISNDLREALVKAAARLENVPAQVKDWHPGSGEQVLDLVHPSMYPLVYGQSKILADEVLNLDDCMSRCGHGQTLSIPSIGSVDESQISAAWSTRFQWLPTEFEIPAGGQDVQIMSYINNLNPQTHKNLYSIIEQVVAKAIPLWNLTLTPLKATHLVPLRVQMKGLGYEDRDEDGNRLPSPRQDSDEENDDYDDRWEDWRKARKILQPQPEQFKPPAQRFNETYKDVKYEDLPLVDLRKDFGRLQIIVKLASIHLTPEKPAYDGGSWHVEGQLNENICSTALYYYEAENISESLLSFRRFVDPMDDIPYEQSDFRAVEEIYGIESEGPSIQVLGNVVTKEGRLLTFPNILQHRVAPFRLSDPAKPGYRKILALFLVDPFRPIISTANVPCQQRDTWADQIRAIEPLSSLPVELADQIINVRLPSYLLGIDNQWYRKFVPDFPVSLAVAKEQRLELMAERSIFVENQNNDLEERHNFYLCEH